MKVKPLLQSVDTRNFIHQYLTACGVEDVDAYLEADLSVCDDPWWYPNIVAGVKRLKSAIKCDEKIGVLIDEDFDGYSSATIIYRFIKKIAPNQPIIPIYHVWKAHGLVQSKDEDVVSTCIELGIDLLICPDSSSNDTEQAEKLKELNIDCLVLDHHKIERDNPYAIVINHLLCQELKLNTALSGCGVTFKFIQACAEAWDIDLGDEYYDLVAASLVSDSCDMRHPENYALVKYGFNHMTNPMLIALFEEFNKRGDNPHGLAFGAVPKINAITRWTNQEAKDIVFKAFVGEGDVDKAIELAKKAHEYQSDITKQIVKKIEPNLDQNHKVLVAFNDPEYRNYSGLVANKLTGSYGKPSLVLRRTDKGMLTGSLRSPIEIADKVNESGLATCQGHLSACGCWFDEGNLDAVIDWFDKQDLSIDPCKNVAAILNPKQINLSLCKAYEDNMLLWGGSEASGIPQPKFYVTFETTPDKVAVFAKKTKTVKFEFGDVSILKFRAKADDVEMLQSGKCKVEAIVTLGVNEWNEIESPQGMIESWEVEKVEDSVEEDDWREIF